MRVFPTSRFFFDGIEADIERRTLSGGTSIAGEEDVIEVDGGGRVYAQFTDPYLDDPEAFNAMRAIVGLGEVEPWIVPLGDARHQMFGDVTVPPNGFPWWQESDFAYPDAEATATADASLGAATLQIDGSGLTGPIRWGIWFSIDHPTLRHRAYRVVEIDGDEVTFRPPLREAVASGATIEFRDPKCTMRLDTRPALPTSMGYGASDQVRFVEFPGVPT